MSGEGMPESLAEALDSYRPSKILKYDFVIGLGGAAGGIALGITSPRTLADALPIAGAFVGVVIGAVLAGVAVLAAFLDQAFMKKLKRIDAQPIRYMRPFLFTAALGVVASLFLLILVALPGRTPTWLTATVSGLTGMAVVWTLASVLPCLDMLVQFIGLRFVAADVPEEEDDEGDPSVFGASATHVPNDR
jgi:hypothetical protein